MTLAAPPAELSEPARDYLAASHHDLLIGGERRAAADGRTFCTVDPATGRAFAQVAHAGPQDVDRAVRSARAAFEGAWARARAADRGALLERLAVLVEANGGELAELESLDNGKPVTVARRVDVAAAVEHLRYFAGWPTKIEGEVIPVRQREMLCYTRREPVGVCGQIIPWNFPLLMACWKIAPALAAGCTVVLKPAQQTPMTTLRLGELALEAGIPGGVLNVITGDGATGAALVAHPDVDKIAFTGSTAVGREIGATAGRTLKRFTLELGGKSPNIICPDADVDAAIKGSFMAGYFNSGQMCTAGSRLFVPRADFDDVVTALAHRAGSIRVGPGLEKSTELGPLVSEQQHRRVTDYIAQGRAQGAELVTGGGRPVGRDGGGYFLEPTLFAATSDDLAIVREEIFGPVLVALPYQTLEEAAARANDTEYGLAAGVWTRSLSDAHNLAAGLHAGTVYINQWGSIDPSAPFGGIKASGIGREHGRAGLDAYLETKTVWASLA